MAYVSTKLFIEPAQRAIRVELFFPTDLPAPLGQVRGVITLLHGLSNSALEWVNLSSAYRYASDKGYILVIPEAENSFYNDMRFGAPFYTIITDWLPEQLNRIFKIPAEAAKNHIAGVSMGGYGALRIGLANPNRYRNIGSFSGAVDIRSLAVAQPAQPAQPAQTALPVAWFLTPVFGPQLDIPNDADAFYLLEQAAKLPQEQRPRVLATCGLSDNEAPFGILNQNRRLAAHAATLPIEYKYLEWDGTHEWYFWDRSLVEFIDFIEHDGYAAQKQRDWTEPAHIAQPSQS
jgi:putative lysine transport system ATP-binding protein